MKGELILLGDNKRSLVSAVYDGEALPPFEEHLHKTISEICGMFQIPAQLIGIPNSNIYHPAGRVVEGTLAKRDEEDQ